MNVTLILFLFLRHKLSPVVKYFLLLCFLLHFFSLSSALAKNSNSFVFALILSGPHNDHGWNQAHFEAAKKLEKELHIKMLLVEKVNPIDRPGVTIPVIVEKLIKKGAKLIITTSYEMQAGAREAALRHPETYFLHISGDDVLIGKAPFNMSNLMGQMEYSKMMAGFIAALTTRTGKIGYIASIEIPETRRLIAATYLGALHAWQNILHRKKEDLQFQATWIGFWFHLPGITSDPSQVAASFFDQGFDVIISGINTTEALKVAQERQLKGQKAWAIMYDYIHACHDGPQACLGTSYYNWKPGYKHFINAARTRKWKQEWLWLGPDWSDINNSETSSIGFLPGPALSASIKKKLNAFQQSLAKGLHLFKGPLYYENGSVLFFSHPIKSPRTEISGT